MTTSIIGIGEPYAGQVCVSSYPALIEEAIVNAHNGDMFAPFRPRVLEALASEYIKGPTSWLAVTNRFKQANKSIPLNDLDRAMRNSVVTAEINDEHAHNYSVVMGAALAAAEAGDERAPFQYWVLEAFVGLWVRDEKHPREVGRAFERANNLIVWCDLKAAIEARVFLMLGTPRACDITWLADYQWDRCVGDAGESFVYRSPANEPASLTA